MKIRSISKRIAEIECKIEGELQPKLDTLNAAYAGIKNRRDEKSMATKKDNRTEAAEIKAEISKLNKERRNLEWNLDNQKTLLTAEIWWIVSGLACIIGIVLLTIYHYRLGLFGLTDTHDLVAIIHGDNPVMNIELYKALFWMHYAGCWTVVLGLIGSIITSIWYWVVEN